MSYEIKEKQAVMFAEPAVELIGSGETLINGERVYLTVLRRFDRKGAPYLELLQGVGRLFYNAPETKSNPKSPDVSGKVSFGSEKLSFSAWSKTASNGNSFLSAKLEEPYQKDNNQNESSSDEAEAYRNMKG